MDNLGSKKIRRSTTFKRKVKKMYTILINKKLRDDTTTRDSTCVEYNSVNCKQPLFNNKQYFYSPVPQIMDDVYDGRNDVLDSAIDGEDSLFDDDLKKNEIYAKELRNWAIQFNIRHEPLKHLLGICNKRNQHALPKDPRTLLHTPTITAIQLVGLDGQYWHQGLEFYLKQCFAYITESIEISINVNIDGLPIYKSSREEFWPILFNIYEHSHIRPMVIGIYSCKGKPPNLELFIRPFVNEAKGVLKNGIIINGQHRIGVKSEPRFTRAVAAQSAHYKT